MTDHYKVLGIEPGAKQDEVQKAFNDLLSVRKARRGRTADLHAAIAVLGDPTLRRAFDLARFGEAAGGKIIHAKAVTLDFARDNIPEVDIREVASEAWQLTLKATVLGSGFTAKLADTTALVSRRVQTAAAGALKHTTSSK